MDGINHKVGMTTSEEGDRELPPISNEYENKVPARKYPLPTLLSAFPYKCNPFETKPNEEWINWIYKLSGLSEEAFGKIKGMGLMVGYFWPFCDDMSRYECLIKFFVLFFVWDDHTENSDGQINRDQGQSVKIWAHFRQMLVKLEGNKFVSMIGWEPYVFAMYAVLEDIYQTLNEVQKPRFIEMWIHYMEGNLEETEFLSSGKLLDSFEEYSEIRIKSIGSRPCIQMIEYAVQMFIPEDVWDSHSWQSLMDLVSIDAFFVNDFYSFEKEVRENPNNLEKMFNIVALFHRLEGISVEKSLIKCSEMFANNGKDILKAEDQLLAKFNNLPVLKTFLDHLNYLIGGLWKSHTIVGRYNHYLIGSDPDSSDN